MLTREPYASAVSAFARHPPAVSPAPASISPAFVESLAQPLDLRPQLGHLAAQQLDLPGQPGHRQFALRSHVFRP